MSLATTAAALAETIRRVRRGSILLPEPITQPQRRGSVVVPEGQDPTLSLADRIVEVAAQEIDRIKDEEVIRKHQSDEDLVLEKHQSSEPEMDVKEAQASIIDELVEQDRLLNEAQKLGAAMDLNSTALKEDPVVLEGVSLNCFSTRSKFRRACFNLATSKMFERFIMACIIASGVSPVSCDNCFPSILFTGIMIFSGRPCDSVRRSE